MEHRCIVVRLQSELVDSAFVGRDLSKGSIEVFLISLLFIDLKRVNLCFLNRWLLTMTDILLCSRVAAA